MGEGPPPRGATAYPVFLFNVTAGALRGGLAPLGPVAPDTAVMDRLGPCWPLVTSAVGAGLAYPPLVMAELALAYALGLMNLVVKNDSFLCGVLGFLYRDHTGGENDDGNEKE